MIVIENFSISSRHGSILLALQFYLRKLAFYISSMLLNPESCFLTPESSSSLGTDQFLLQNILIIPDAPDITDRFGASGITMLQLAVIFFLSQKR